MTGRAVQRRRLALLALLAVARRRGLTRDKLIGLLWPDANADRARHLLSDSIYRINQAVGGEGVVAVGDELRLNPERLPSDAWEFAEAMDRGDWERAVELHVAPFLDGFFLTDADELERWVEGQRERLARERARALEALAPAAEARVQRAPGFDARGEAAGVPRVEPRSLPPAPAGRPVEHEDEHGEGDDECADRHRHVPGSLEMTSTAPSTPRTGPWPVDCTATGRLRCTWPSRRRARS